MSCLLPFPLPPSYAPGLEFYMILEILCIKLSHLDSSNLSLPTWFADIIISLFSNHIYFTYKFVKQPQTHSIYIYIYVYNIFLQSKQVANHRLEALRNNDTRICPPSVWYHIKQSVKVLKKEGWKGERLISIINTRLFFIIRKINFVANILGKNNEKRQLCIYLVFELIKQKSARALHLSVDTISVWQHH